MEIVVSTRKAVKSLIGAEYGDLRPCLIEKKNYTLFETKNFKLI